MRLPYVPNPPPTANADEKAIVERIQQRRHPRSLQPLDLTLLHSPAVANGWNEFLGAIRTRTTSLSADLRELAIARVAVCNKAWYEWNHHAPLAVAAGVAAHDMEDVVRREDSCADGGPMPPVGCGLSEKQWLVLRYTDEMTRKVQVSDELFSKLPEHFGNREIVEITATVRLRIDRSDFESTPKLWLSG